MTAHTKSECRKLLLAKRRAIKLDQRAFAAENAANLFAATQVFQQSQHIAAYYPTADEFDCLPLIKKIWEVKKNCYLPMLTSTLQLDFGSYQPDDTLHKNRYHIYEPTNTEKINIDLIDLVIIPLVGFDLQGNRLGMGAGYYDRTFGFLKHAIHKKCLLFGLAYEAQYFSTLPHDSWDVPLDGILTEEKVLIF
ncbi:MAG: 5-formyltetrahydrofolate cyclo-ligase [Gammaproteobacteria bacterium]